jgi:hypothetical protein
MDKMRIVFLSLAIVAALVMGLVVFRFLSEDTLVDMCLDVQHGSFDYSKMVCDTNENHPYVAYGIRHPHDRAVGTAALLGILLSSSGYIWTKKSARVSGMASY